MSTEIENIIIWALLDKEVRANVFIEYVNNSMISSFISTELYESKNIVQIVEYDNILSCNCDEECYHDIYCYFYNNIIYIFFRTENGIIRNRIALNIVYNNEDNWGVANERICELMFKLYESTHPLFIRTAHKSGSGDPEEEERIKRQIYSLHWMQIFSKEMLQSINVEKLKKSDKFYKVEGLDDGAMFIQITKEPGYTYRLIKELSDEIEIKCPEKYRWWEPKY